MIRHGYVTTVLKTILDTSNPTFKAQVKLDSGEFSIVYVKPLDNDGIANELFAYLLGQTLKIPIPDPCIVSMDSRLINDSSGKIYNCYGSDSKNNSMFERFSKDQIGFEKLISDYNKSFDVAIFDEWIFNEDRNFENILLDGADVWFIDHEKILNHDATIEQLCRSNSVFDIIQRKYPPEVIEEKREHYKKNLYPILSTINLKEMLLHCIQEKLIDETTASFIEEKLTRRVPYLSLIIDRRFCLDLRNLEF